MTVLELLRKTSGLSQKELAAKLRIPQSTLSELEAGRFARPFADIEKRLCRFYGGGWTWEKFMAEVPSPSPE